MTTLKNALLSLVAVAAFATPVFADCPKSDDAAAVDATATAELDTAATEEAAAK